MKTSTKESLGKNPMGINPTNQTAVVEKFPIGFNPTKSLGKSFESNGHLWWNQTHFGSYEFYKIGVGMTLQSYIFSTPTIFLSYKSIMYTHLLGKILLFSILTPFWFIRKIHTRRK